MALGKVHPAILLEATAAQEVRVYVEEPTMVTTTVAPSTTPVVVISPSAPAWAAVIEMGVAVTLASSKLSASAAVTGPTMVPDKVTVTAVFPAVAPVPGRAQPVNLPAATVTVPEQVSVRPLAEVTEATVAVSALVMEKVGDAVDARG